MDCPVPSPLPPVLHHALTRVGGGEGKAPSLPQGPILPLTGPTSSRTEGVWEDARGAPFVFQSGCFILSW